MKSKYSTAVVPTMVKGVRSAGLLTAITNLKSPRFTRYLKKPAQMLRDGWQYQANTVSRALLYTLGGNHGMRQELLVNRNDRQVVLRTFCPNKGQTQQIVFCMETKEIIENKVETIWEGARTEHAFISLPNSEGMLRRLDGEVAGKVA